MKKMTKQVIGFLLGAAVLPLQTMSVLADVTPDPVETDTIVEEVKYEDQLREAGFPESYLSELCALHELYPSWQFYAVDTGLEWETVIEKESRNSWNLIQKSSDDAKKSTAEGAYDWTTNTWTVFDGSTWVGANPEYIAYCMDPRNFLDEKSIFQFEQLSFNSGQTKEGVESILRGTFMEQAIVDTDASILDYAEAFMQIGKETGVSPYHLASRVRQEQGSKGTNSLISGKYSGYKGYFNFFNVGASGVSESVVVKNGLEYAKKAGWDTRYKSLLGGAKLLAKNYISLGQDTLYFQKFNVVNHSALYSHQYMSNITAAITEGQRMAEGYENKEQAFLFRIPVYNHMPEQAVTFERTGNPNNYLKSLEVDNQSLTPSFDGAITRYSIVVDSDVTSVCVNAEPVAATSKVSGTGILPLEYGENQIYVVCNSQSGDSRIYTLNVVRQEGDIQKTYVSSDLYRLEKNRIIGIQPGTTIEQFLQGITVGPETGRIRIVAADGSEDVVSIATGTQLMVYDLMGNLVDTYQMIIFGDVNGDGAINVLDMIQVNRYILGLNTIEGCYLEAADANRAGDGANVLDMIHINRHSIGLTVIRQND